MCVLEFLNTVLHHTEDLKTRMKIRDEFVAVGIVFYLGVSILLRKYNLFLSIFNSLIVHAFMNLMRLTRDFSASGMEISSNARHPAADENFPETVQR